MKRNQHFLWLPLFLLFATNVNAQCPPGTLILQNQASVDAFATNYPDCTEINGTLLIGGSVENLAGLDAIEKVAEDLLFDSNNSLTDISGLNQLDSVGGNFFINNNSSITAISGFEALSWVNGTTIILNNAGLETITGFDELADVGTLEITTNAGLQSITGFGQLTTVGSLKIENHPNLSNISGLENLTLVDGNFLLEDNGGLTDVTLNSLENVSARLSISQNDNLLNISGLQNLMQVGDLFISLNNTLGAVSGLNQLSTINDNLNILGNPTLTDISGLDHPVTIGGSVLLISNDLLGVCAVNAICQHIFNGGVITLQNNASGCNSTAEVEANCTTTCPPGDIVFNSQAAVAAYAATYPNCTIITGNLSIGPLSGGTSDISDLSGLSNLVEIQGDLAIQNNSDLSTISGLNQITTVGGELSFINNNSLTDTSPMQLNSIGESAIFQDNPELANLSCMSQISIIPMNLGITSNSSLQTLSGLSGLNSVNNFVILNNDMLTDISALDHPMSLTSLSIEFNNQLSMCSVQAVCDHLLVNGSANISSNGANCSSSEQVTAICTVSTEDAFSSENITIYPNPSNGVFNVSGLNEASEIIVYDMLGQMIYFDANNNSSIDISAFAKGIYWLIIKTPRGDIHKKLLLE